MLRIITAPVSRDYGRILQIYQQSLQESGKQYYPNLDENRQVLEAEQDFYLFLKDFFREENAFYAMWEEDSEYVSALRVQSYRDGVLISGLETKPLHRGKGYAKLLLLHTLGYLQEHRIQKVYSHIRKDNIPSIRVHCACDFSCIADYAAYLDGSVDSKGATYLYSI